MTRHLIVLSILFFLTLSSTLISCGGSDNSRVDLSPIPEFPTQIFPTQVITEKPELVAMETEENIDPIEVVFLVETTINNGTVLITIETNLPDNMEIIATIESSEKIMGQAKGKVSSGSLILGPFTSKGEPYPAGEYFLSISSPLLGIQPEDVQKPLGEDGSNFIGSSYAEGRVQHDLSFFVEGDYEEITQEQTEELTKFENELSYLKAKLTELDSARINLITEWGSWSRDWNIDLNTHRELFFEEFGQTMNEYDGYCSNARFNLGVAYGDLFILWQDEDALIDDDISAPEVAERRVALDAFLEEAQTFISECQSN